MKKKLKENCNTDEEVDTLLEKIEKAKNELSPREKENKRIRESKKTIYSQYGFRWKGAKRCPTTAEKVIQAIEDGNYAHYDIEEDDTSLCVCFYSSNDMF